MKKIIKNNIKLIIGIIIGAIVFGGVSYAVATVYTTRSALETAYGSSSFADRPVYIRSAYA